MNSNENQQREPSEARVVIIGGGFAGLKVAQELSHSPVSVQLIDRRNYHLFQPLLYQVAAAQLSPANIAAPIRNILRRQKNVEVALGEVTKVDLEQSAVEFDGGRADYDYLVIAMGVRQSYFGHDEFSPHAPGLKSIDDALEIRRRVLLAFEEAEWEVDDDSRRAKLTFVIVGGGPTGVELAGAIMDVASVTLPTEFRKIDTKTARVILVQGASRLVPTMPEDLGERVQQVLKKSGVEVRLNSHVTEVDDDGVVIGEERLAAENVFWAAGVQGQNLAATMGVDLDRGGRIVVGSDFAIPGHPNVFVVGDAAHAIDGRTKQPVPGLAQGAIQAGRFVARIIKAESRAKGSSDRPTFDYHDKGSMAMIGRGNAVAAIGNYHFGGFVGWLTWSLVHVVFLIGFGNRVMVMLEWFWNYVRKTRNVRLITGDPEIHIKRLREDSAKSKTSTG